MSKRSFIAVAVATAVVAGAVYAQQFPILDHVGKAVANPVA